jgi:signal transduction histidine kinase
MEIIDTSARVPGPASILMVDDNPSRLMTYRTILEPLGENLVEASSGMDALRRVMDEEFAVILLDVNMPDMDGFETASLIHQHPRFEKTPIIFVSAVNVSEMDRLRGYKLGAVDYVMVPIIPEILRSKVMVLAELFRKRSELQGLNSSLAVANAELAEANEALQAEKAREVHKLNQTLRATNMELAQSNKSLQMEILERRSVEDRLLQADRRKDEFLATLAHELRNPLAPMQSALSVRRLAHGLGDGEGDELQNVMERQMGHLVRLVDDLLDISRITRDRLELRPEQVEMSQVIDAALETVKPMLLAARQTMRVDMPIQPLQLFADPHRLSQVFANLLSNASKFSGPGTEIELSVSVASDTVSICVRDQGMGIDADHLRNVFDMFTQLDSSLERSRGGLGIGLTLARRLVEMHGGRLAAASAGLGKGSEFTVILPLSIVEVPPEYKPSRRDPANFATKPLRIMVIDDNKDSADMLALTLKMMGHEVLALYDPLTAVDAALAFLPELAFLDVGMPVLNGFALAAQLRLQDWPAGHRPRLVALTGWGQAEDRRRSEAAGFDEHLVKPAALETIERVCQDAIEMFEAGKAATS